MIQLRSQDACQEAHRDPHSRLAGVETVRSRFVLLDPGLFFEGGHHATLARLVCSEAERRALEPVVFGARRIDNAPSGLSIRRHFRTSAYAPLSTCCPERSLNATNAEVLQDAHALPTDDLSCADTILIPTVTSRIALGLARWIHDLPESFETRIALVLMFQPGWAGDDALRAAELSIYKQAMGILASLPRGRVALFAETTPIGRMFERLGSPTVRDLPWPVLLPGAADAALPFDPLAMPPHIAHLGYTKMERGIGLVPGVIRSVMGEYPTSHFTVQGHFWDPVPVADFVDEIESLAPATRVLRGPLHPNQYAAAMRESDIALLPYDPKGYRDRGSGIFGEAAVAGKILVLPENTWMAAQAREWDLAAICFDRFDVDSISDAVCCAIRDRSALLCKAAEAAPRWTADRSASAFFDRVRAPSSNSGDVRTDNAIREPRVLVTTRTPDPAPSSGKDDAFTVNGLWTPQTQMLREIRGWVCSSMDDPATALSVDRNPTLDQILLERWPNLAIEQARYPEFDVQDLSAFNDCSIDLTYSHQVLEHVPKPWIAATELVRVLRRGGLGIHTTCAANPRHGLPAFKDYYRFLPDGLEQLFEGVDVLVKDGWGNRQALLYNYAIDDGHGALGGRRFSRAVGEPNEENYPWHTWIIFRKR